MKNQSISFGIFEKILELICIIGTGTWCIRMKRPAFFSLQNIAEVNSSIICMNRFVFLSSFLFKKKGI